MRDTKPQINSWKIFIILKNDTKKSMLALDSQNQIVKKGSK